MVAKNLKDKTCLTILADRNTQKKKRKNQAQIIIDKDMSFDIQRI